jgi:hypothetical protein
MKNRLLAHVTITRQHSGGGTMLAGAYVTRVSTVALQNQQSLFKVVKPCQIKKL